MTRAADLLEELEQVIAEDTEGESLPLGDGLTLDQSGNVCLVFLVPLRHTPAITHEVEALRNIAAAKPLS